MADVKIGIISFYNNGNFGSSLQAFALHETIKDLNFTPVYITVRENRGIKGHLIKLMRLFDLVCRHLRNPTLIKRTVNLVTLSRSLPRLPEETKRLIQLFVDEHINYRFMSRRDLRASARNAEYLAFICGSDQIWSPNMIECPGHMYLQFAPRRKRIAYAPSVGVIRMPKHNAKVLMKRISQIEHLSVRESTSRVMIKEYTRRVADVVLDPTLLVPQSFWIDKLKGVPKQEHGNYILCYFLSEVTDNQVRYVENLSRRNNLGVVVVPYKNRILGIDKSRHLTCGPMEFVSLVQGASIVCTDSYHGTLFSINLNRPFLVFDRHEAEYLKQTSRIEHILSVTGLKGRMYRKTSADIDFSEKIFSIDFTEANGILVRERSRSMAFLTRAIRSVEGEK